MRNICPASHRARIVLSFILFAPTAFIILDQPVSDLQHGFPDAIFASIFHGNVSFHLAANLAVWFVCLACLILMGRIANDLSENPPLVFTSYIFFVFILYFATERLIGCVALLPQLHWLNLLWIQILSSFTVAMGAVVVLPRLRSMKEANAIARKEHDRFLAAAESSLDDFYIFDGVRDSSGRMVDFRFSYINPNAERRLNTPRESMVGKILTEVRPFMISSGLIEHYREVVRTGIPFTCEVFIDDEMIKATWLNVQVIKLGDGIAITSRDVTERKCLDDKVSYLAHYDQLTGLANRALLQDRLRQAILLAQRHDRKVAVFMLDIDRFKHINDSLGHAGGDAVLRAVGQRLLSAIRQTDTIARVGGDEFVIVMSEFESLEDVERCGTLIASSAAQPLTIGDREIDVTLSVGVCIYPDCGLEAGQLLKNADSAMYGVKARGRNGLRIFTESMLEQGTEAYLEDARYR
jgi:diguanylate cyclase (GGDEF)-like protein